MKKSFVRAYEMRFSLYTAENSWGRVTRPIAKGPRLWDLDGRHPAGHGVDLRPRTSSSKTRGQGPMNLEPGRRGHSGEDEGGRETFAWTTNCTASPGGSGGTLGCTIGGGGNRSRTPVGYFSGALWGRWGSRARRGWSDEGLGGLKPTNPETVVSD